MKVPSSSWVKPAALASSKSGGRMKVALCRSSISSAGEGRGAAESSQTMASHSPARADNWEVAHRCRLAARCRWWPAFAAMIRLLLAAEQARLRLP
jgi:hypothetical protein